MIKRSRVKGTQFVNYAGKTVPERKTGQSCNCKKECFSKIDVCDQIRILDRFNSFTSKYAQDIYLQGLIISHQVQRRRPSENVTSINLTHSFKYFVTIDDKRNEVCQKAFIALHSLKGDGRVHRLQELLLAGKSPVDLRGKNPTPNAKPADVKMLIHQHIESCTKKSETKGSKTF